MAFPEAWEETCLVSIEKASGTPYQFAAITETVDISEPDVPGESVSTVAGGRIWKQSPQEDGEITMEIYPIELDTTTSQGLFQQYAGGTWDVGAEPLETDTAYVASVFDSGQRQRDKFRVAILWTNDPNAAGAESSTAGSTDSLRFYATDCRMTSHKSAYTDGILKVTATFKFSAFNKAGTTKNYAWQSADQTALEALAAY